MLIDFADALSINVYQIGGTFLDLLPLVTSKEDTLPLVDPSLYISRFAAKLEFGEKTQDVIKDANRIVLRFSRDWITQGRRPAGICAASLFIAARMHGFQRTIKEIVLVTKICENVVRIRLKEFENTPSGQLTVADFQSIWLEQDSNPPSFGQIKKQKRKADDSEIENVASKDPIDYLESGEDATITEEEVQQLIDSQDNLNGMIQKTNDDEVEDDNLSDLDDDPEVLGAVNVSKEAVAFKESIWISSNQDWLLKQEEKELRGDSVKPKGRIKVSIIV